MVCRIAVDMINVRGKRVKFCHWKNAPIISKTSSRCKKISAFINSDNQYEYFDEDVDFKIGESRYYSVTSIDENGLPSGRTNISRHEKNIGSVENLDEVFVVPNPFVIQSGFGGAVGAEERIGFYGLPKRATIRIFTYSGQLVETVEHDDPVYSTAWFQVTRNDQQVASGIYIYVITTPNGEQASGKFIVIK